MHSSHPPSAQRHLLFKSGPRASGPLKALRGSALATVAFTREAGAVSAQPAYVAHAASAGKASCWPRAARAATIYVDAKDWPGVIRAAGDLQADVKRVTGIAPAMAPDAKALPANTVIIGTIGKSAIIDRLVSQGKIDVKAIKGKWESFFLQTVANPLPGVASALVIVGSDKRATIFGIYDLSEQIGVSPWYWWADVAPTHQDALFVKSGKYGQGEPSVKYRGIFFNDEKPDLDYWVRATYGTRTTENGGTAANMNHDFYSRVFEVILRMKGNYLWPAMWNNGFALDDPENPKTADYYGVVMGSSHQEPMNRAQKEWDWVLQSQYGGWNFATMPEVMDQFWREGVQARKDYESVYTMGLRGENDSQMTTADLAPALLEQIVASQRKILAETINPDVTKVPQLWCLYKEVQGYYENGLRVPDDITLLWAEDNWGDVRRLPTADERKRAGGAGIYYHFDYHGGPRSYQWQNTSPIAKIWDQMSLAKQYGADRVWIVNVGHFKGYEFPTEYFLSLGWDAKKWTNANLNDYTKQWTEREFGPKFSGAIADIIEKYSKYNGRRKPELLAPQTYSLTNYDEADRVLADFEAITKQAEAIQPQLPKEKQDAFYELPVLFPTKASAQVNEMNVGRRPQRPVHQTRPGQRQRPGRSDRQMVPGRRRHHHLLPHRARRREVEPHQRPGPHRLHFLAGTRPEHHAGGAADHSRHHPLDGRGGRWLCRGLAHGRAGRSGGSGRARGRCGSSRTGRGRCGRNRQPAWSPSQRRWPWWTRRSWRTAAVRAAVAAATLNRRWLLGEQRGGDAARPNRCCRRSTHSAQQHHKIELFNRGTGQFSFTAEASAPWIKLGATAGSVDKDYALDVSIDWSKAPVGSNATGTVRSVLRVGGGSVPVTVNAFKPAGLSRDTLQGFVESEGYVSIEAEHYSKAVSTASTSWQKVQDYGNTLSGMRATSPVDVSVEAPGPGTPAAAGKPAVPATPCLEYRMYLFNPEKANTLLVMSADHELRAGPRPAVRDFI